VGRTCTLNDIALTAHAPIKWARRGGVAPCTTQVITTQDRAEEIYERSKGQMVSLKMEDQEFKVWILALEPGPTPLTRTLQLTDTRWLLSYLLITMDANVKRISVERRLKGPILENAVQLATTIYAPHSLNGDVPWTARTLLEEMAKRLREGLNGVMGGAGIDVVIEDLNVLPTLEIVDWRFYGSADEVVGKLLTLIPGLQVECDDKGRLRFYSEAGLGDRAQVKGLTPYADASNDYPIIKDLRYKRPSWVTVQFAKEMELRFDYYETDAQSSSSSSARSTPKRPSFNLANVVQVNEPEVTYNGTTYGYGSWMVLSDYVAWLGTQTLPPTVQLAEHKPSMKMLRKHFFSGFQVPMSVYMTGGATDPLWQRRWQTLLHHYRQTFAIDYYWYERLLGIEAVRSTVYDPVRNVRAPAEVYCNYTVRPTWRGVDLPGAAMKNFTVVNEVFAGTITDSISAPFEVVIEDHDAMILRIVPRRDFSMEGDLPVPGTPVIPTLPDASRYINDPAAAVQRSFWTTIELDATWQMAVILTATIGTPNDNKRNHHEMVTTDEAQSLIGSVNIGEALGPVLLVGVDPGLVRARSTWLDDSANEIKELVWNGGDIPPHLLANPKILRDVAKAAAARIYESMARRLDGNKVRVPFKPDLHPAGALAEVEHVLNTDGRLMTTFSFFNMFEPRDMLAYLPEGTKRVLQRAAVSDRRR
jgi:hypothetical protein